MLTRTADTGSHWLDVMPVRITALEARGPSLRGPWRSVDSRFGALRSSGSRSMSSTSGICVSRIWRS